MSNESMTKSSGTEAVFLAAQARIAAIPAGGTLIDTISDSDWLNADAASWMVNTGSDSTGNSEELDESDKETVCVA
jgi:hypothetical protein